MGEVVYRSQVRVVRRRGIDRLAALPAGEEVAFGAHGAVAEHYRVSADDFPPTSTTLDYLVAAAAGWLTGTFGGALEARNVPASGGRLTTTAVGEVELEERTLVLRRILVTYHLKVTAGADREKIDRVMRVHPPRCPVYRSIHPQIEVTVQLDLEELGE